MITDSFDESSEPIVTLKACYGEQRHICDTCVVTFSDEICAHVLASFPCEEIAHIRACNGTVPIYAFEFGGKKLAFYLSHIGATGAGTDALEANWLTGATRFVMFGSAGSLDRAATDGRYVIPTKAYRDEGMSYHYAPPADYIALPGADAVAKIFDGLKAPYVMGGVWTTDAVYRETRAQMEKRRAEGCLAVDMELAGAQAVCSYRGLELYAFLQTGDVLDGPEYDHGGLHDANHSLGKLYLALELAKQLG